VTGVKVREARDGEFGNGNFRAEIQSRPAFDSYGLAQVVASLWEPGRADLTRKGADREIGKTVFYRGARVGAEWANRLMTDEDRAEAADWAAVQVARLWPELDDEHLDRFVEEHLLDGSDEPDGAEVAQ
jgi:hypothetical protein